MHNLTGSCVKYSADSRAGFDSFLWDADCDVLHIASDLCCAAGSWIRVQKSVRSASACDIEQVIEVRFESRNHVANGAGRASSCRGGR